MKKYLLDSKKGYYKANLHCHSTVSDGHKTPEELKEMYKAHGYSVLAYTDHDVLLDHQDLTDKDFLALNGLEMEINEEGVSGKAMKCCHICFIALESDNLKQFCYHRSKYLFGNAPEYRKYLKFDDSEPDFEREYTPECISKMMEEGRKNGFFVTYNHPGWSLETVKEYGEYHGMNAMEICNYGCFVDGYPDYNEKDYDAILRGGEKIYCVSTDDNHNRREDSFGGFTMINTENLEYREITKALEEGKFYASQGPEIYDLWYEDGKIGITCSAAAQIVLNTGIRRTEIVFGSVEEPVTSAVFTVGEEDMYSRITVTDFSGKHANTSAYYSEDFVNA